MAARGRSATMKRQRPLSRDSEVRIARERLASERGAITKDWGGRLPFVLVYPNSYYLGMSNLGLQAIYQLLNAKAKTDIKNKQSQAAAQVAEENEEHDIATMIAESS